VRRFLLLLAITATVWVLVAQVRRGFELPTHHGEGVAQFLGLPANPAALYTFGPDPTLVPGARWFWVGRNLLRWSEVFDSSVWLKVRTTVNASGTSPRGATVWALAATTDGQSHRVQQSFSGDSGVVYSLSCDVKAADKSVAYLVSEDTSPTDSNTTYFDLTNGEVLTSGSNHSNPTISSLGGGWYRIAVSFAGSDTECCVHVAFAEADGDPEWTGDGTTIDGYATAMQLEPGTSATAYQKTEAQQTFHDWSGNGNTASRGSDDEAEDTNDPQLTPSSRNLLEPGSTEDLTDSNWTATDANTTATTFTPTAQNGQVVQSFTTTDGADYVLSATISSAGNTSLQWVKDGSTANLTVTATPTRYSTTFTGDGNAWNLGLRDPNSSGFGAITFTDIQLEIGSTATVYTNPAEESVVQGATFDGVDDYVALPDESALKPDAFTVVAVLRMHDATDGEPVISWSATDSRPAVYARSPNDWGNQSKPLIYLNSENYCYFAETIETETWHVLAVTVPGSGQTDIEESAFYLDGTPLTVDTAYSADSQLSKGQPWLGRAGDYYGNMDQALIAIYSRAISAAETQCSYRSIVRLYWDYRGICVSGWESHCQSPPLHAKLLAPWQPDGTWALAMLPQKLGLVSLEVQ